MNLRQPPGLWYWHLVWATLGFSGLLYAQEFYLNGFHEESVRQVVRWTARASVVLFSMAFAAAAVHGFWKNAFTFWLRLNRKHLGISFALSHLIHLGFLVVLQRNFHPIFEVAQTVSLVGGGLAYLFLVGMLLTSFPFFANKISQSNWKLLHTAGGWWIWFIFTRSYWKRAATEVEYLPLLLLLLMVLLLRLAAFWKKRKAQAAV